MNNAIGTTDWTLVGTTLANGINAIFLYAKSFAETFDWNGLGVAAGNGIMPIVKNIDQFEYWKNAYMFYKNVDQEGVIL